MPTTAPAAFIGHGSPANTLEHNERIEQAKADWRAGRMRLPDLDNQEFVPLPRDEPRRPR